MKLKFSKSDIVVFLFFFFYFFTYINSQTTIKYVAIILFQLFLISKINFKISTNKKSGLFLSIIALFISLILSTFANLSVTGVVKTLSLIDVFI